MAEAEETTTSASALSDEHGVWGAHPTWPVQDWKTEVENDDTRLGYWDWVASQIELHSED
jgi:hypothetical protein